MKKSQKSTEITPLEAALQRQFKPDAGIVRKAFDLVEENRSAFAANALKFGLCALAAKSIVGHGNFGKWLSEALSDSGNARPMAERTAKDYIGLAKIFVEKFSAADKLSGHLAEAVELFKEQFDSSFDIGIVLSNAKQTEFLINSTVRGMTLTQLRQLLREGAERAYDDEQAEQQTPQPKSSLRGLQSGCGEQSPQMMLWEDWTNELGDIDKLVKHKDKLRLSNDQYKMIAQKLRATADEIESLIKA